MCIGQDHHHFGREIGTMMLNDAVKSLLYLCVNVCSSSMHEPKSSSSHMLPLELIKEFFLVS
jgi:hypothetical protein